MVRKALQLLILPPLFALLMAGSHATLCSVLGVLGLEAHHHGASATPPSHSAVCLHSHEEEEAPCSSDEERVPCPESCRLTLSEAPTPGLVKVPDLLLFALDAPHLVRHEPTLAAPGRRVSNLPDPPERSPDFTAPAYTGRFLL